MSINFGKLDCGIAKDESGKYCYVGGSINEMKHDCMILGCKIGTKMQMMKRILHQLNNTLKVKGEK